jgi:hypothetical protein
MISFVLPIITIHTDVTKTLRLKRDIEAYGNKSITFKPLELSPMGIPGDDDMLFPYTTKVIVKWRYDVSTSTMIEYGLSMEDRYDNGMFWLKQRDIVGLMNKGYEYFEAMVLNDTNLSGHIKGVDDIDN